MPTSIGKLQLQDDGDPNWGPVTEANLNRLEEMIASEVNITSTGGDVTLTNDDHIANQTRRAIIRCTGTLSSNLNITIPVPSSAKSYTIINAGANGAFIVQVRFGSGSYVRALPLATTHLTGLPDGTAYITSAPVFHNTGFAYGLDANGADPNSRQACVSRGFVEDRVTILLDRGLNTPPGTPATGDTYLVGSSPTGAWASNAGDIARWNGVSAWIFSEVPAEGLLAWVVDEGKLYASDAGTLVDLVGAGGVADGAITAAKLASSAVETAKINDSAVTTAKIAAANVTAAKLASDVFASESVAKTQTSTTVAVAPANVKHAAFPAGTVMLFRQTAAPIGWTKVTSSVNNKTLRVVSGTVTDGGSMAFTDAFSSSRSLSGSVGNTTLTESQIPAHDHFVAASTGTVGTLSSTNHASVQRTAGGDANYTLVSRNGTPDVGLSGLAGGGSSHTHSLSMNTLAMDVQYIDVILATKDSP